MTKQPEKSTIQKRKRVKPKKSELGNEAKKRRPASKETELPDKELLRVLTGQDDNVEQAARTKTGAMAKNGPPVDEVEVADGAVCDNPEDETKAENEARNTNSGTKERERFGWLNGLSEAHAKKVNVTVLLENANLETVKQSGRGGGFVLLNCDDHRQILKKTNREANDARPDITHQCLLALMDSPLNKAGKLKVYVRTSKKVLIEIHPQTRVPRTMKRFCGLMAELLEKLKVRGTSGSTPLLKVIRNPITSHLPVGTRKIVCTYNTENVVDIRQHAASMAELVLHKDGGKKIGGTDDEIEDGGESVDVLYVVGAMAHGKIMEDWADEYICVSEYPLSAATVCSRITYAYECLFGMM